MFKFLRLANLIGIVLIIMLFSALLSYGFKVREELNSIESKEYRANEVYISQTQVALSEIVNKLVNKDAWNSFLNKHNNAIVYFDPRSGRPVSIIYPHPIIPGKGDNNNVTLQSISNRIGHVVKEVNREVVKDLLMQHLKEFNNLIRINLNEIGEIRINQISESLWHAHFRRQINGIPVRESTIAFSIKHGNLVLWGLENWSDVNLDTTPKISKEEAIEIAFRYIGGRMQSDTFTAKPHLEIIPISKDWNGEVGKGYDYALVWVFSFKRDGYQNNWEFIVDANTGKIYSFLDKNMYAMKKIVGAIYPVSNDECCPDGCASTQTPAPYINTGFAAPNDYTNFGGLYNYTSGTVLTTLDGRYVVMGTDYCGTISESSSTGDIDLGGTNGQHDCTVPTGHSTGDTFSSRSCAIEVTHLNRQVASWLDLSWLNSAITCNVNIYATCNAYYSGNTINFYRSGSGCRNTGEIAAVFDHEWGHGVDYNDTGGGSSPNEAIADLSAAKRLQNSCIGRGFFWTMNRGCGQWTNCPSNPGPSYGYNCSGYSSATECCLECTGIREIDYMKHADTDADTISNFTCSICSTSGSYFGPCGREAHCEGIPPAMVGWDLAYYDLEAAPFNLDKQTAFLLADKIIWQGHDNVTNWYSCTCPNASGCAATNAHTNWLVADDDDGNINNGTPHASAIYAAMNRHGIACTTLPQTNSGCSGGPSVAPTLSASPSNNSVALSWNSVSGASSYYVWRTEGAMGCDFGKVKIATVSTTSYTDAEALNGRTYYYTVQAVGSNVDCLGPLSNCVSATPVPCESCAAYLPGSASVESISGGDGDDYLDNCESATVQITVQNIGSGTALNTNVTITSASSFLNITTPMPINVGNIPVGGTANANFEFTVGAGSSKAGCMENGTFNIEVQSTGQDPAATDTFGFTHEIDIVYGNINWPFETGLDGWTVEQGTWSLSTARVNPGGSTQSLHSSQNINQNCDIMISPELTATSSTVLHTPNWYDIEPYSNGYWYDRANVWVVQGTTETVISPTGGKTYASGTFYDWINYCNQGSDKPGWSGSGPTWGDSAFNLASYAGQTFRLRIKYMTDDLQAFEGIYLDDMYITNVNYQGCDQQSDVCTSLPQLQPYNGLKPIVNDTGSTKPNGIFEPGENAQLVGTLENIGAAATSVTGLLTTSDSTITITDANASYPDINSGDHQTCTNCYALTPQTNRPATHWDFVVTENVSATGYGPVPYNYTYHVGESFTDVPVTNLFYLFIETLLHSGVTAGCSANQYCPLNNVQRQAMGKFICLAMESSSPGSCSISSCAQIFGDVPSSNPFCSYIEALYNAGIVNGCQTNPLMYCPTNYTARQAMAKFICMGMEAANPGSCPMSACTEYFNDVPSTNPFCTYIEGVFNAGVVNGCQTNPPLYCPTNNVTRQQMAKFLVN